MKEAQGDMKKKKENIQVEITDVETLLKIEESKDHLSQNEALLTPY